jgi:hypothetical protein
MIRNVHDKPFSFGRNGAERQADASMQGGPFRRDTEHYDKMHPRKALGYRSPRESREQFVEETTETAVGAGQRPHGSTMSADAAGSRPQLPEAVALSARPKAASGARDRTASAAPVKPKVNCHRNPRHRNPRNRGAKILIYPICISAYGVSLRFPAWGVCCIQQR